MPFDAKAIEDKILEYSSLTRIMIGLGFEAARGIRALINEWNVELTPEQRDDIYNRVMSNSKVSEALSRAIATSAGTTPTPPGG